MVGRSLQSESRKHLVRFRLNSIAGARLQHGCWFPVLQHSAGHRDAGCPLPEGRLDTVLESSVDGALVLSSLSACCLVVGCGSEKVHESPYRFFKNLLRSCQHRSNGLEEHV